MKAEDLVVGEYYIDLEEDICKYVGYNEDEATYEFVWIRLNNRILISDFPGRYGFTSHTLLDFSLAATFKANKEIEEYLNE